MAFNETFSTTSGRTLYGQIWRRSDGQIWSVAGGAFEAYLDAHWANYAVAMPEQGTSGVYLLTSPTGVGTVLVYDVLVFARAGGSAAIGDAPAIGNGTIGPQVDVVMGSIAAFTPIVVNPVFATMAAGDVSRAALVAFQNAVPGPYPFPALGYSLAGKTIEMVVFDQSNGNSVKFTISGPGIVISGAGTDTITATGNYGNTPAAGNFSFVVWNVTDRKTLFYGSFTIRPTAGP